MDLRKVIKFGKATYSMTLPKEWVVENDIKKGDLLRVEQIPIGKLEVTPNDAEKEKVEVKEIQIDAGEKEPDQIYREVIAAYIRNYTVIRIKGDMKGKIKELRKKLQELIGLEIMEVSTNKIMAKNFLDVTETNVEQVIRRVFYNIKAMSEEFKECMQDYADIEEINEMDREVNRNAFFMIKYLFKSLENPRIASERGMKPSEILFTWELIRLMESIADKIKMMANIASDQEVLVKQDSTKEFLEIYSEMEENFYFTMGEYFKKRKDNVHQIFETVEENERKANDFLRGHTKAWTPLLVDHLKDVNMFTRGVAEIIIDLE